MNYIVYKASYQKMAYIGTFGGTLEEAQSAAALVPADKSPFYRGISLNRAFRWEVLDDVSSEVEANKLLAHYLEEDGAVQSVDGARASSALEGLKASLPEGAVVEREWEAKKTAKKREKAARKTVKEEKIARKARAHSDETKAKIAAYRKGKKHSITTKEKIAASRRGKNHSDETKAKQRAGTLAYWDRVRAEKATEEAVAASTAQKEAQVTPDSPQIVTEAPATPQKKLWTPPVVTFRGQRKA